MVAILGDKAKGERGHIFRPWLKADRSPEEVSVLRGAFK